MHLKRWLTSIVALPLLVLLVFKGGAFLFSVFAGMVACIALWEYVRIVSAGAAGPFSKGLLVICLVVGAALLFSAYAVRLDAMPVILSFGLVLTGIYTLRDFRNDPGICQKAALQTMGGIYISLAVSYAIVIRQAPAGGTAG